MSKVLKTGRVIKTVKAYGERPKEPTRKECADLTDAEFAEWHKMWDEECREFDKNNHAPNPNRD